MSDEHVEEVVGWKVHKLREAITEMLADPTVPESVKEFVRCLDALTNPLIPGGV